MSSSVFNNGGGDWRPIASFSSGADSLFILFTDRLLQIPVQDKN
jgi:hypothetical protein